MIHKTPEASFHSGLYEVKLFFVSFVSGRASLFSSPLLFSHSQLHSQTTSEIRRKIQAIRSGYRIE